MLKEGSNKAICVVCSLHYITAASDVAQVCIYGCFHTCCTCSWQKLASYCITSHTGLRPVDIVDL